MSAALSTAEDRRGIHRRTAALAGFSYPIIRQARSLIVPAVPPTGPRGIIAFLTPSWPHDRCTPFGRLPVYPAWVNGKFDRRGDWGGFGWEGIAPRRRTGLGNSTDCRRRRSLSVSGDMTALVSRRHGRRPRVGSIQADGQALSNKALQRIWSPQRHRRRIAAPAWRRPDR